MKRISKFTIVTAMIFASPVFAGPDANPAYPSASGKSSSQPIFDQSLSILSRSVSPSAVAKTAIRIENKENKMRGAAEIAVYKNVASSVVLIVTMDATGTGGVISEDGLIVTNWHVVEDAPQVAIIFKPAGLNIDIENANVMSAEVLHIDKQKDLALLQLLGVFPIDLRPIRLGTLEHLEIGADTHAIGHPSGYNWTYTKGFVSGYRQQHEWTYFTSDHMADVIQTQTPINPGNSGGPLLNNEGHLIGINSYTSEGEGLNFSVSVDEVRALVEEANDKKSDKPEACEVVLVFSGRDAEEISDIEQYDRDCDGIVDFVYVVPDSLGEAIYVIFDDNQDSVADGYVFDENRDDKWNISYWDTTGDGEMDVEGIHLNGELYPTEYAEISDR